ncbi:MAG: TadE/TadG family type IV pilus assembly protein [Planctomycetota bacterium]|jgi:hypothetical protein
MARKELIRQRRANRRGFALLFAAVTVLILFFVGFGILRLGMEKRMRAVRTTAEISARAAADAGLTKAIFEMNKNLDLGWNFSSIVSPATTVFSSADASYTYTITEIANDAEYEVTSVGQSGLASETVSANVAVQGTFDYAIFAQGYAIPKHPKPHRHKDGEGPRPPKPLKKGGKIEIKGYSVDDGYSSGAEAYSGPVQVRGNNVQKRAIKLRENVVVNGDVIVGPGGKPDKVIEKKSGAAITGDTYPAQERQELLSVAVPTYLQVGVFKDYVYDEEKVITGSQKYTSLIIPEDAVQEIGGNCQIYVQGSVKIEEDAQLVITPGSSLRLYVGGEKFEVKKKSDGLINQTNDPTNLLIFGLDDCRKVKIENPVDFYGAVYAPFAKVEMKECGDLYGAFVGWDVKLKKKKGGDHGTFYFDRSLRLGNILAGDDLAARIVVRRWH